MFEVRVVYKYFIEIGVGEDEVLNYFVYFVVWGNVGVLFVRVVNSFYVFEVIGYLIREFFEDYFFDFVVFELIYIFEVFVKGLNNGF